MSSANVRRSGGFGAVLAAAFMWGFAAEAASVDEFWRWRGLLIFGPLALLLTATLAASFEKKVPLLTAVVFGVVTGCLTAMMLVLGVFSPFALELGERDLNELGPDLAWDVSLALGLIFWGAGGAVVGAACGVAAWALRFGLGQVRSAGDRDTRETAR